MSLFKKRDITKFYFQLRLDKHYQRIGLIDVLEELDDEQLAQIAPVLREIREDNDLLISEIIDHIALLTSIAKNLAENAKKIETISKIEGCNGKN